MDMYNFCSVRACVVNDMQIHVSTMCFIQVYVQGTINYTVQLGTHNVVSKVKRGDKLASLQNTYTALLTSVCSGQSVVYMQFCFT